MTESASNLLYYGDNLDILRRYVKDETVDLVYLDPLFNSNTNYNVLFAEKDGSKAASQIQAFSDTWTWTQESESVFAEIVTAGGKVSDCLQVFRKRDPVGEGREDRRRARPRSERGPGVGEGGDRGSDLDAGSHVPDENGSGYGGVL